MESDTNSYRSEFVSVPCNYPLPNNRFSWCVAFFVLTCGASFYFYFFENDAPHVRTKKATHREKRLLGGNYMGPGRTRTGISYFISHFLYLAVRIFSVCVLLRISCSLSRFLFIFVVAYVFFSATSSSIRKFPSLFLCLFVNVIEVTHL